MFYICVKDEISEFEKVQSVKDEKEYMTLGRVLCRAHYLDAPENFDGMKSVLKRLFFFYEVYETERDAKDALSSGCLPDGCAQELQARLDRRAEVTRRDAARLKGMGL